MNVEAFRHLYDYHFSENRNLWNTYIVPLSQEQFVRKVDYSVGSVRNHIVHLMSVDDAWFSALRGLEFPNSPHQENDHDRGKIRKYWDDVEHSMREYLLDLRDDMLFKKPFAVGEDKDLILWQVLIHIINHGTDHRAQLLRILYDLGAKTLSQDYVFYVYENPQ